MSRSFLVLTTAASVVLLFATNCWWLYAAVDQAATNKFRDQIAYENERAIQHALILYPLLSTASRDAVLAAAKTALPEEQAFDKDGYLWVGELGFGFGSDGRLREVCNGIAYDAAPGDSRRCRASQQTQGEGESQAE